MSDTDDLSNVRRIEVARLNVPTSAHRLNGIDPPIDPRDETLRAHEVEIDIGKRHRNLLWIDRTINRYDDRVVVEMQWTGGVRKAARRFAVP